MHCGFGSLWGSQIVPFTGEELTKDDALSQFRDEIRASGMEPPQEIEPGKLHRISSVGKRNLNTSY